MAVSPDAGFSRGDVMRRLSELEREVAAGRTARRLEAARVGAGGVVVRGGQILIQDDDGNTTMTLSTDGLGLQGALDLLGGKFAAKDDQDRERLAFGNLPTTLFPDARRNRLVYTDENGVQRVIVGETVDDQSGELSSIGLLIQDDDGIDLMGVRGAPSDKLVVLGQDTVPLDMFFLWAETQILIDSGPGPTVIGGVQVQIGLDDEVVFIGHPTTGSSANCVIDPSGLVQRSTSSRRYKEDIRDWRAPVPTILDLAPRSWRDKADPGTQNRYMGLVAEEVDSLGLSDLVVYDEQGRPDGVAYDRLSVALLDVVRQQQTRLSALEQWAADAGYSAPAVGSTPTTPVKAVPVPQQAPRPLAALPGRPSTRP